MTSVQSSLRTCNDPISTPAIRTAAADTAALQNPRTATPPHMSPPFQPQQIQQAGILRKLPPANWDALIDAVPTIPTDQTRQIAKLLQPGDIVVDHTDCKQYWVEWIICGVYKGVLDFKDSMGHVARGLESLQKKADHSPIAKKMLQRAIADSNKLANPYKIPFEDPWRFTHALMAGKPGKVFELLKHKGVRLREVDFTRYPSFDLSPGTTYYAFRPKNRLLAQKAAEKAELLTNIFTEDHHQVFSGGQMSVQKAFLAGLTAPTLNRYAELQFLEAAIYGAILKPHEQIPENANFQKMIYLKMMQTLERLGKTVDEFPDKPEPYWSGYEAYRNYICIELISVAYQAAEGEMILNNNGIHPDRKQFETARGKIDPNKVSHAAETLLRNDKIREQLHNSLFNHSSTRLNTLDLVDFLCNSGQFDLVGKFPGKRAHSEPQG